MTVFALLKNIVTKAKSEDEINLVSLHSGNKGKYHIDGYNPKTVLNFFKTISTKNLGLAECPQQNKMTNLYFDFDICKEQTLVENLYSIKEVKDVIKNINNILKEICVLKNNSHLDCIYLSKKPYISEGKIKHGFHLHYPNIFFQHEKEVKKNLYNFIKEKLTKFQDYFDTQVCVSPWLLYNNSKAIDKDPYLLNKIFNHNLEEISIQTCFTTDRVDKDILKKIKSSNNLFDENDLPLLLSLNFNLIDMTFFVNHEIKLNDKIINFIENQKFQKKCDKEIEKSKRLDCFLNYNCDKKSLLITELLEVLSDERYERYEYWRNIGFIIKYELEDMGFILFDNFSKKSTSKYDDSSVERFFNSIGSNGDLTLGTLIYYALEDNENQTKEILKKHKLENSNSPHSNRTIKRITKRLNIQKLLKTETNVVKRKQFDFSLNGNIWIKSNMGAGKTTQLRKYIKNSDKKIIIITPRVTLAEEYYLKLKEEGFKFYQDLKSDEDYKNVNKLIIQIDSLYKIKTPYEIAIFDEIETLNYYFTDTSLIKEKDELAFGIEDLIKNTLKNIFMDANLEESTMEIINNFSRKNFNFQECFYKPFENKKVNIKVGHNSKDIKTELFKEVLDSIKKGENICIPVNSKRFLKELYSTFKKEIPDTKIIKVSSEDKLNSIEEFGDNQISIFTGALLCGNNFDNKHFDKIIAYFSNHHSSAKLISQQLLRVRQFENITIYFHENNLIKKRMTEENLIENWKKNREERLKRGIRISYNFETIETNWFFQLNLKYALESINSSSTMLDDLVEILLNHGFNISIEEFEQNKNLSKINKFELNKYEVIQDLEKVLNSRDIKDDDLEKRETTLEEKLKYTIQKNFNIKLSSIEKNKALNLIENTKDNIQKHKNYVLLAKYGIEKTKEIQKHIETYTFKNIYYGLVKPEVNNQQFLLRKSLEFIEKYNILTFLNAYEKDLVRGKKKKINFEINYEEFIKWFNLRSEEEEKCKFEKIDIEKDVSRSSGVKIKKLLNLWGIDVEKNRKNNKFIVSYIDYEKYEIQVDGCPCNYDWVFENQEKSIFHYDEFDCEEFSNEE